MIVGAAITASAPQSVMIFVDISTFLLALRWIVSEPWRSPKRILWTGISIVAVTSVYMVNVIGRLLDELFFPAYRDVKVLPPLVIAANPRSGSTYLHRLLCRDRETFAYFRLYHTLFPAVTLYRLFDFFLWLDRVTGRPLTRLVGWLERRLFGGWEHVHDIGLGRAEEDEGLFLFPFATPALYMLFPFFREVPGLRFADGLPEWKRKAVAGYYESSVKRFLYATGSGNRIFLMKSVLFAGRMKLMAGVFPDARVVYLVRDPCEAIPSAVNMFTTFWSAHSPDIPKDSERAREWARLFVDYYRYFHENRQLLDGGRLMAVRFADLVSDPAGTVRRIYGRFGLSLRPELVESVANDSKRHEGGGEGRNHTLEEYGIDRQWVLAELEDIYTEYGLERV